MSGGELMPLPPSLPLGDPELMERPAWRQAITARRLREEGPPSKWGVAPLPEAPVES